MDLLDFGLGYVVGKRSSVHEEEDSDIPRSFTKENAQHEDFELGDWLAILKAIAVIAIFVFLMKIIFDMVRSWF